MARNNLAAEQSPAFERFFDALGASLQQRQFHKLVLAGYRGALADLQRVSVRLIGLRDQASLSFVYSHQRRDVTHNLSVDEGLQRLRALIGTDFANAHLHAGGDVLQLAFSRKGRCSLRIDRSAVPAIDTPAVESEQDTPQGDAHNRVKQRLLDPGRPFLAALGVTDAQQRLVPAMARKWKQINRFLEIFSGALAASPLAGQETIEVLDFGSGKGYLTFALHDYLRHTRGLEARVTGIELRTDMVELCNATALRLGLQGLSFEQGDVSTRSPRRADVMIALHACDTATDHAMHSGIRAGAAIICCAPCCHKQLRAQLLLPQPLRPMLQHGVHLGQHAEMLTDSLRALLLEACGYDTKVFEFVSLEHTAKNKMVLAVKRAEPGANAALLEQLSELKAFHGIRQQCLETLLRADALI